MVADKRYHPLVFAYGTLRRGADNHHLLRDSEHLGWAWTVQRYALYVDDFPYVIRTEPVARIRGEIYRVRPRLLAILDRLEGHPHEYRREQVPAVLDDGEVCRAWLYFYPQPRGILVPDGDFALVAGLEDPDLARR